VVALFDLLARERTVAGPDYNRWLVPPTALAIHLAIGQAYAFSVFNLPLTRVLGVSEPSPEDWKLTTLGWIFSLAMVFLGLSAAVFGKWLEAAGPRKAMFASAACFGGGFLVSAVGVWLHQVWLIYLGYGVLGGIGLGLGYISPVSTLIKWFPDRPGMATGLAIMGFGGGAMVGAPLAEALMAYFRTPTSTGVAETFVAMGAIYFCFMMFGAVMVRLPPPDWRPVGYYPEARGPSTTNDMTADEAIRTPQFWLLWAVLFLNVTAGIGVLGQASPMIQELFSGRVGAAAAAGFVGLLSLFNMAGRLGWSSLSDTIGRRNTYTVFFLLGAVLYALTPQTGRLGVVAVFVLGCGVIMSMYGGGFATIPAYLRDQFGTAQVGAIHGRLLTAWSAAGIVGPVLVNYIRQYQIDHDVPLAEAYTVTMYLMAGLLLVGLVCNLLVRPAGPRGGTVQAPGEATAPDERVRPETTTGIQVRLGAQVTTPEVPVASGRRTVLLLVVSWLWVGIPLAWGVLETLRTSLALFR
jgi:MFS family permease